jgi:hypothetical protein
VFTEFGYRTHKSWSRSRRVVAKAEQIEGKQNPRYVVTSLNPEEWRPRELYEQLYCARGEMENRIKEQMSLFAGRMSAETMRANQLRLYLSAAAYVLVSLQVGADGHRDGAHGADHPLRLLKIGARIRISAACAGFHERATPGSGCLPRLGRRCLLTGEIGAANKQLHDLEFWLTDHCLKSFAQSILRDKTKVSPAGTPLQTIRLLKSS